MSKITINGKTFDVQGNNISVVDGVLSVDGKVVESELSGVVKVEWQGDLVSLYTDASVTCGTVVGGINAGGSINCGSVGGDVDAGGSVNCGSVRGDVNAGGSIHVSK